MFKDVINVGSIGPRFNPSGTPYSTIFTDQQEPLTETYCLRSVK